MTLAVLVVGGFVTASAASAKCLPGPVELRLPAQRLDERLQALSHRTGCFVDVAPALLAGKRAPALNGHLTTDQAFIGSLKGSGLRAGPNRSHWRVDRNQQDRFAKRITELRGLIATRRYDRQLAPAQAARLRGELAAIGDGVAREVRAQGFLSAAERSTYTARIDAAARAIDGKGFTTIDPRSLEIHPAGQERISH